MSHPFDFMQQRLGSLAREHSLRVLKSVPLSGPTEWIAAGSAIDRNPLVNFGSNDYLGLASRRFSVTSEARHGSGASPLVCGHTPDHQRLADLIAELEQVEAAVLFPSGYAACSGTVATLPQTGDLILSDQLNHASLIDGCRLSRADRLVYPHGDCAAVEALLIAQRHRYQNVWIITDSVFGMDGDLAPLPRLCDLAERYGATLIIDEAHATGILGDDGSGAAAHWNVKSRVPIRIGTLSKAIGSHGGFVAGPRVVIDYLINFCRPLIFSTAASPLAILAAIDGILAIRNHPELRTTVRGHAARIRQAIGWHDDRWEERDVPIIPVLIGDNAQTLRVASLAAQAGLFIPAIRPPTVPEGSSRLRISVSAAHRDAEIDALIDFILSLDREGLRQRD